MNKYWFKPKKIGWGITPISWEGWLVTLLLVFCLLIEIYLNDKTNFYGVLVMAFEMFVSIVVFIFIFRKKIKKTG